MSRHYNKSSSRKMSAVCTTSIQFDTLFKENSNRPSAAKSAGTVGKWGVTSFTSIRGTNVLSGNNGTVGAKRGRADSSSNDAFAFDNDSDGAPPPIAKPKKFFKSRNAEPIPLSAESKASAGAVYSTNITDDSETPIRPMRTAASRKMVSGTPSPPESRASTSSMGAETESSKPPIVLRIFKGTSQLITTPSTPTSPEDEFDLHLVDEVDTGTSSSRGKQSSTGRGKRTKERRERSRDESPETETVLRVNTAMSRAQRYSRRQAAIENSENESDHVTPIPVPKKAARGRIAAETMENDPSPASKYNLYASPAGNSSSHEDEPETESPESHSYNNSSSQLDYNSEPAQLTQMTSTISTARNELHTSMVPSPALPDAFMETDSPTPDRQTDCYSEAEEEEQQQQPEVDYVKPTPGAQLCEQRGEENVKGLSTELYAQEETPEPQQELYSQPELYSRIEAQEGYGRQEPSELYNRSEPTDLYSQAEPTDLYGSAETGAGAHYSRGESVAHYTRSESNEHYGRMEPGVTGSTTHYGQVQPTDPFSRTGPSTISNEAFVSSQQNAYVDPSQSVEDVESLQPTAVEPGSVEQFEHMTARERFARRNRNAAESSSTAAASGVELSFGNPDSCADSFANGSEAGSGGGSSSGPSVVTRKKGSIFKSRALQGSEDNKKRLALYKHKWCDNQDGSGPGTSQPNMSNADATNPSADPAKPSTSAFDMPDDDEDDFGLRRVTTYPKNNTDSSDNPETVTSVKCSRDTKGFYTVVRNVKKAHQIQESGEFQEFNDDVEYILDALQEQNPIGTRCLSAITLASKCMVPAFRMHVRAHGTVAKFFKALNDSARDQSLGLCTATVMFALSQDRLNMDLDRDSLELMLNLLESDASHRNALEDCGLSSTQLWKNKQKVRELCAEIQSQGHAKHLNLDNITVGQLAMETLLSLTSRRAGEWFKEELRELGGLEHIVRTICQCSGQVDDYVVEWTDSLLDRMRKIDRCLRVLENVTQHNEENQMYLLRYMDGALVDVLVRLLRLCGNEVPLYPVYDATDKESTGVVIREALLAVLKVLINLSHDFKGQTYGSTVVGAKEGLLMSSLHMLLHIPSYIVEEKKFDLTVLALTLMINLVEHNAANRLMLINTKAPAEVENMFASEKSAVEALIGMFYRQEEFAKTEEAKTDAILDGKDDDTADDKGKQDKSAGSSQNRMQSQNQEVGPKGAQTGEEDDENEEDDGKEKESKKDKTKNKSQDEFIEETVAKLLAKAGRHMEHTFVAAYIALLLGYVIMDNKTHEDIVRHYIPEHNFKIMVAVLQKFFNFMNLTVTATGSSRGLAATETVIKYMAKIDEPPAPALDESRSEGDLPSDDLDGSISS